MLKGALDSSGLNSKKSREKLVGPGPSGLIQKSKEFLLGNRPKGLILNHPENRCDIGQRSLTSVKEV